MGMDITGLGSLFELTGKVLDKIFPGLSASDTVTATVKKSLSVPANLGIAE